MLFRRGTGCCEDGDETERSIERSAVSLLLDCTIMFSRKAVLYVVI
jgi:hypothetical protein